jgi:hypothetical protein
MAFMMQLPTGGLVKMYPGLEVSFESVQPRLRPLLNGSRHHVAKMGWGATHVGAGSYMVGVTRSGCCLDFPILTWMEATSVQRRVRPSGE